VPFEAKLLEESTVIIKGGAPKSLGAYVRRCLAAPLFYCISEDGGKGTGTAGGTASGRW